MGNFYNLTRREVVGTLFREKWRLAAVFLAISIGITVASFLVPQYYEATSSLLVKSGREFQVRSDQGEPAAAVPYVTKQEIVNSEIEILTNRQLVEDVIDRIGLKNLYPRIALDPPVVERPIDAAIKKFLKDFKVTPVAQSEVIDVGYYNEDRDMAIKALALALQLYQAQHAQLFSTPKSKFLEQQTTDYETQLAGLDQKIANLKVTQGLEQPDQQRTQLIQDRSTVTAALRDLQGRSIDAHRRIDFLKAKLKTTNPIVEAGDVGSDAVEQAKSQMLELRLKEQALTQRYVTEVKPIRDVKEQIGTLQSFLDHYNPRSNKRWTQRNPAYDDLAVALQHAEADAGPLDEQIALQQRSINDINARLAALEEGDKQLNGLQRDRDTLTELVHTYRDRYEEARINEDLDKKRIVSVSVIERPDSPTKVARPKHLLVAIGASILGLMVSGCLAMYMLIFRQIIITVESLERVLQIPVLASVPIECLSLPKGPARLPKGAG
jgi:uncharacterized protein involved in exopolysaccharide biosynthesis